MKAYAMRQPAGLMRWSSNPGLSNWVASTESWSKVNPVF